MKFKQNLSLLLWLYRGKASKDEKAPIYLRITVDGLDTHISLGQKVHPDFWDGKAKQVRSTGLEAKMINQKILQAQTDLQRHFMRLQAQFEWFTHAMLKNVYSGMPVMQEKKTSSQSPKQFGAATKKRPFKVGLELVITWVKPILFSKLLEAQLVSYKGDEAYAFLYFRKIKSYDDLISFFLFGTGTSAGQPGGGSQETF